MINERGSANYYVLYGNSVIDLVAECEIIPTLEYAGRGQYTVIKAESVTKYEVKLVAEVIVERMDD